MAAEARLIIRSLLSREGVTQSKLAERLGYSHQNLNDKIRITGERQNYDMNTGMFIMMAESLGYRVVLEKNSGYIRCGEEYYERAKREKIDGMYWMIRNDEYIVMVIKNGEIHENVLHSKEEVNDYFCSMR